MMSQPSVDAVIECVRLALPDADHDIGHTTMTAAIVDVVDGAPALLAEIERWRAREKRACELFAMDPEAALEAATPEERGGVGMFHLLLSRLGLAIMCHRTAEERKHEIERLRGIEDAAKALADALITHKDHLASNDDRWRDSLAALAEAEAEYRAAPTPDEDDTS